MVLYLQSQTFAPKKKFITLNIALTTYGMTYPSTVIILAFLTLRRTTLLAKHNISFSYLGISISMASLKSSAA